MHIYAYSTWPLYSCIGWRRQTKVKNHSPTYICLIYSKCVKSCKGTMHLIFETNVNMNNMKDVSKFNKNSVYWSHKEGSKQLLSNIFFVGSELCLPCHNIKPSHTYHNICITSFTPNTQFTVFYFSNTCIGFHTFLGVAVLKWCIEIISFIRWQCGIHHYWLQ